VIDSEMANTAPRTEAPPARRTYTLTHALAIRAYGEDVASRYARPGADYPGGAFEHEARVAAALRERELRYPTTSRLPGADSLLDLESEEHLQAELTRWEAADLALWNQAQASLLQDLVAGRWYALNQTGRISVEFWQDTDMGDPRVKWWCYRQSADLATSQTDIETMDIPITPDAMITGKLPPPRTDRETPKRAERASLRPYNVEHAKALLVAEKMRGKFHGRIPTIGECADFLRPHFTGIPSEKHRRAVRQIWPKVSRGPRKSMTAE